MFGKSPNENAQALAADISHGVAQAEELYRKAVLHVTWFHNFVCGSRRPPNVAVAAMGCNAAAVFKVVELARQFIASANEIAGINEPPPLALPADWTYTVNADGTITLNLPPSK